MIEPEAFGCVGSTIRLRSGRHLDLLDPRPEQFVFADIAGGLARICRFGGQINRWYSVAEHCVHAQIQALVDGHGREAQLACLLHDAAEAFAGDVVKPLKRLLSEYYVIEQRLEAVIGAKYGIDWEAHSEVVGEIDRALLIAERRELCGRGDGVTWTGEDQVRPLELLVLRCWGYEQAEERFRQAARGLGVRDA